MIELSLIAAILLAHWLGDFVLQTHWMASNKSKNFAALAAHVGTYTACMGVCIAAFFAIVNGALDGHAMTSVVVWALVNGLIHINVDAVTSNMTSLLWKKERYHDFFVVVGCDQAIHYITLFWTAQIMLGLG